MFRNSVYKHLFIFLLAICQAFVLYAQAPANDDCSNAAVIAISNNGYDVGTFVTPQINLTNATIQPGETFAPALSIATIDKKSAWYKFSIPTTRAVTVTLSQPGTAIPAGDAGFTVYKASGCLPANTDISAQLTSIVTFGNTYHPCVTAGEYFIQVAGKASANGPVDITVTIADPQGAAYDRPAAAFAFGVASNYARRVDFDAGCHSTDVTTELCNIFPNSAEYRKTAWFTFTTPAYSDYILVTLSGTNSFFTGGGPGIFKKFGYTLYQGDAVTTPVNSLSVVQGCDSLLTDGYHCGIKEYVCGALLPNTTYSIQLFMPEGFTERLRLGIITGGTAATVAPLPVTGIGPSHALGNLTTSTTGNASYMIGYFGCNSKHSVSNCNPSVPAGGINFGGHNYNLSSFGTFSLLTAADINIRSDIPGCGSRAVIRLFKQTLTSDCASLDMANLIGSISPNANFNCLPPGDYVVQILGIDSALSKDTITYKTPLINTNLCLFTNLGGRYVATITGYSRKPINEFSLSTTGSVDSINVINGVQQPLPEDVAVLATPDTFGCSSTVRPSDTSCYSASDRIMYRQFAVADSGTVIFETLYFPDPPLIPVMYKLFKGDAAALTSAQNIFEFPNTFTGLIPNTECINGALKCNNKSTCVVPGTYTFTTMGTGAHIGIPDQPTFTFSRTRTKYNSPFNAEDMGNIIDSANAAGTDSVMSDIDRWSCDDNAVPINNYIPCPMQGRPATKAIYRQFYLKEPSFIEISNENKGDCAKPFGIMTLFSGKATDGLSGLDTVSSKWICFNTESSIEECQTLGPGWYTIISWATGPNYDSTMRLLNEQARYNSYINYTDQVTIKIITECRGPQFNRPYKASVKANGEPHLFEWAPTANNSSAYPETFMIDTLPTEYFNCTSDTPFALHPINPCIPSMNKVAYYVFKTTQVAFVQINTNGLAGKVYNNDVRYDSLQFDTAIPVHECAYVPGYIQLCNLQPGTYTLVVFAGDNERCRNYTPEIYIDSVGYSRFDFAQNAYDFGTVPPDSLYHFGKTGDVNPIDANRPPSSDIIFCTTGSAVSDPANSACNTIFNGNIYSTTPNQPLYNSAFPATGGFIARRNLWYTFVVAHPGRIDVRVQNKTGITRLTPQFAVFRSNVDGSLPFTAVQANGLVDSTISQGLQFIVKNYVVDRIPPPCYRVEDTVSLYRPACEPAPTRYYVVVDNVYADDIQPFSGQLPNSQIDVSVLIDSLELATKFDHYYQAGYIVTNGPGIYTGEKDNYSCATRDANDPLYTNPNVCNKTLWYKITPNITGNIRYRININNNALLYSDSNNVKLFRQTVNGDSTFNGLSFVEPDTIRLSSGRWSEACVSPGTYYLLLPGCSRSFEDVVPEIELTTNEGDFCNNAVGVTIAGAGNASNSVKVNCHTIGTDYGEFGTTLTCPPGATTTQYKTSWFRMDVTGADTLDVTASLAENTNAVGSDIKYRLMTGDCGAMQEQSCVLDGLTQNTYQCLVPGQSYYLQVITPIIKNGDPVNGTIELRASAVAHTDSCSPLTNCLAQANFTASYNCAVSTSMQFSNYSTFGSNIEYEWSFGFNNQTSTSVSPSFLYPALPYDSSYNVRLIVKNTGCGKQDTLIKPVTVPARPLVDLGNDIIQCNNSVPVILNAPVYAGAIYVWQDNSNADSLIVTANGQNIFYVTMTYNGCTSSDTINVFISTISAKPLQTVFVCSGNATLDGSRGSGETYLWSTNETASSITVSTPGFYWVDVTLNNCTYRDSFEVNIVGNTSNVLGNDTTICFSAGNYVLNAATQNAVSYTWQDGSTADTLLVSSAGEYHVSVNLGTCTIKDTIIISSYPVASKITTDTAACNGGSILLPWGVLVNTAGEYPDTLFTVSGCDSVIFIYNVSFLARPNLGNDTTVNICNGNSINLDNIYSTGSNTSNWSTGNNPVTDVSNINTAGTYQLITIATGGCSDTALISVAVNPKPAVVINNPAVICANSTADISNASITNGSTTGLSFSYWQDTAATIVYNNATVTTGGIYYIKGTDANGCFDIKPVTVATYPLPQVNAGSDVTICNNDSATLNAVASSVMPVFYSWQPVAEGGIRNAAESNTIVKPKNTIEYTITVTDSCNLSASDNITVLVQPPVKAFAGNDTIAVTGQPHQLLATGGINYAWQPVTLLNNSFIANPLAVIYADSILFTVIVKDAAGCTGYDTVKIKTFKDVTYYVPNAFSPNGDGKNDVFRPVAVGIVSTDYFRIFNRYGQLIFQTSQTSLGWDGTYKGKAQQPGNYIWMLKGKGINGRSVEMKGNVILVR